MWMYDFGFTIYDCSRVIAPFTPYMAPPPGLEPGPPRLEGACASDYATAAKRFWILDFRFWINALANPKSQISNLKCGWCPRRDSNAHRARFKLAASAGLGYRGSGTSAWTRTTILRV